MKLNWESEKLKPRMEPGDAGVDLRATEEHRIGVGQMTKVETGVRVEIPKGWTGFLLPRSGIKQPWQLANTMGVIDSTYRGVIIAKVFNNTDNPIIIQQYERFCQLVVVPCYPVEFIEYADVDELSDTERGEGGFNSTGSM